MNAKKLAVGLLLIIFIVGLLWLGRSIQFLWLNPEQKLNALISQDLEMLATQNKLPEHWDSIRSLEMATNNDHSEYWLSSVKFPVAVNPLGTHQLEILVLPWIKENEYGAAINYHLVNLESGVTVAEFGRTFVVGDESEIANRLNDSTTPKMKEAKKTEK